jgi:hypothetical protein
MSDFDLKELLETWDDLQTFTTFGRASSDSLKDSPKAVAAFRRKYEIEGDLDAWLENKYCNLVDEYASLTGISFGLAKKQLLGREILRPAKKNPGEFEAAMKALPRCVVGGLDDPKTVSDLVYQALHELDMWREQQDGCISNREAMAVKKFIQKFGTPQQRAM